jgi:hypothetical protein
MPIKQTLLTSLRRSLTGCKNTLGQKGASQIALEGGENSSIATQAALFNDGGEAALCIEINYKDDKYHPALDAETAAARMREIMVPILERSGLEIQEAPGKGARGNTVSWSPTLDSTKDASLSGLQLITHAPEKLGELIAAVEEELGPEAPDMPEVPGTPDGNTSPPVVTPPAPKKGKRKK